MYKVCIIFHSTLTDTLLFMLVTFLKHVYVLLFFFSYVQSGIDPKYKYLIEIRDFLYSNQAAFYKQS